MARKRSILKGHKPGSVLRFCLAGGGLGLVRTFVSLPGGWGQRPQIGSAASRYPPEAAGLTASARAAPRCRGHIFIGQAPQGPRRASGACGSPAAAAAAPAARLRKLCGTGPRSLLARTKAGAAQLAWLITRPAGPLHVAQRHRCRLGGRALALAAQAQPPAAPAGAPPPPGAAGRRACSARFARFASVAGGAPWRAPSFRPLRGRAPACRCSRARPGKAASRRLRRWPSASLAWAVRARRSRRRCSGAARPVTGLGLAAPSAFAGRAAARPTATPLH